MDWKGKIPKLNNDCLQQWKERLTLRKKSGLPEQMQSSAVVKNLQRRVRLQALTALAAVAVLLVMLFAATAAWYTNVAKTSDLMFKAEAWGFDEEKILLSEDSIAVYPGRSGVVPLTVDNSENAEPVKISVTVNKSGTPISGNTALEELKKRIFFYADAPMTYTFGEGDTATEETVSRVYLGSTGDNSCAYTILGGQKLTLSEDYCNDVPIKWMWCYDMLGYYFTGTVDKNAKTVTVIEYLRPIEYDYANAVFDMTSELVEETVVPGPMYGQMLSTGELSRNAFIEKLTSADGYAGEITEAELALENAAEAPVRIPGAEIAGFLTMDQLYYPITVDENGQGVWVYLCNKNEIEQGIVFDNSLKSHEEAVTLQATVAFTAVNIPVETVEVNSSAALTAALQNAEADVVALSSDVILTEPLTMKGGMAKTIDLNGYILATQGADLADGASLTLMNGEIHAQENTTTAFTMSGSELVLSGVTATGFARLVDNTELNSELPSSIRLANCTAETRNVAVMVRGSGLLKENRVTLIIENCRLTSGYIAVCGNGNPESAGTEIMISNSDISGTYGALYQPQQRASTTIVDSSLSGWTGIAVKGGTVTVKNSTIRGTGEYTEPANAPSGYTDTGAGIYVEAGYNCSASVFVEGERSIVSSDHGYGVQLFGVEGMGPGKIILHDGNFVVGGDTNRSLWWNNIGTFEIYGGTFTGLEAFLSECPAAKYFSPET